MSPWLRQVQEEHGQAPKEQVALRIGYVFVAAAAVVIAGRYFGEGKSWVGARHLVLALLFGLLAALGAQLRSSNGVRARLLVAGVLLVYLVMYAVQVLVPLVR